MARILQDAGPDYTLELLLGSFVDTITVESLQAFNMLSWIYLKMKCG